MIGIGVGIIPFIAKIARAVSDYVIRVTSGGGVVEASDCANTQLTSLDSRNLYNNASFIIFPSGYKAGVVYAELPANGNGDLTWTRGGDGFRTNASGVLQRVPWNLLQYSEDFSNAYWSKTGSSINANSTNAPNSTLTADSLIEDSSTGLHFTTATITVITNTTYTATIYVKANTRTKGRFRLNDTGGQPATDGNFDLSAGTISFGTIEDVGSGWYRLSLSRLMGSTSASLVVFLADSSGTISYTGNGTSGIFIWGAQLVEGTTAQTYLPTTDRLNFPRLSYMYGSCPALLLEPQRTNLVQRSDEFDNAYWSKYLATVSANTATSPDGSTNADLVYPSSTGPITGQLFRQISTGISSGNVVTVSAFVKASGKNFAYLSEIQNSFTPAAFFNLTTGAITNISAGVTASMTQLTNSWWRISITSTAGAGLYYVVVGSTDSAGSNINTASGTNGILVYGYQVELGAYPTTYIQTTNAAATRLVDTFTRNNIYTNGLISASGGTWYIEMLNNIAYTRDAAAQGIGIGDSSTTIANGFLIVNTGTGRQVIQKIIASATTNLFTTTTDTIKIAIKWNGTSADVFVNGTKQVSATAFTTTIMEFLNGTGAGIPRWIKTMALYPTPLSDANCQTLTT